MKILYVEIENILSIQKIRLDLNEVGLILLDGWNYDDDTANGAGKTAILNSISFGLYGKLPRKISQSEILRTGSKSGYVKVGVSVDNVIYEVYRSKPNSLKFSVDNVDKSMTQEEFEKKIKLTYEQYLISMYSSQTESYKLISSTDSGKKDFFLQLMNLDHFDICKKTVDNNLTTLNNEKKNNEIQQSSIMSKLSVYEESLVDVLDIENKIKELDISKLSSKLSKLSIIEKPDTSKIDTLEDRLNNELRSLNKIEDQQEIKNRELLKLSKTIKILKTPLILSNDVECPHCNKAFIFGSGGSTTIEDIKKHREQELKEALAEYAALEADIVNTDDIDNKRQKIKDLLVRCKSKRAQELEEYTTTLSAISTIEKEISKRESQISVLNSSLKENSILEDKILKAQTLLKEVRLKIDKINNDIAINETLSSIFSSTGAPAYILDSAIDMFNSKISRYVSMIWPNASYVLQSFKENKNGDIRAKFSERFINNGKERSIGALSGGEYMCLSIAIDFAVVDVLETMFGIYVSPIMLDEPFNGLDKSNQDRVLDLLEILSSERLIIVVDHASEAKASFSKVIRVEKKDGISSLVI